MMFTYIGFKACYASINNYQNNNTSKQELA